MRAGRLQKGVKVVGRILQDGIQRGLRGAAQPPSPAVRQEDGWGAGRGLRGGGGVVRVGGGRGLFEEGEQGGEGEDDASRLWGEDYPVALVEGEISTVGVGACCQLTAQAVDADAAF